MLEVAEHYYEFGGKSPINDQNRQLLAALKAKLAQHGAHLPNTHLGVVSACSHSAADLTLQLQTGRYRDQTRDSDN